MTDNCNLRCQYCHNEGQSGRNAGPLRSADFAWVCDIAHREGFTKLKLTGGEPTLRSDLLEIVASLAACDFSDFSMITNGTRLSSLAKSLRKAGLPRINVSIPTLDRGLAETMFGCKASMLSDILRGIDGALAAGYTDMKLNYVYRGYLDDLNNVLEFARTRGLVLVLLPLMTANAACERQTLESLYRILHCIGIGNEQIVADNEGIKKRKIEMLSGGRVILRMEELGGCMPYRSCATCEKRPDCQEGIFPIRLSADGTVKRCLAAGLDDVPLRDAIIERDRDTVRSVFNNIGYR